MFNTLRRYIPWMVATLLSILLILSNRTPQIEVLRGKLSDAAAAAAYPVSFTLHILRTHTENRRLRRDLTAMKIKLDEMRAGESENERLRKMLEFAEGSTYDLIAAEVVGNVPEPWVRGLLVNRGRTDGVMVNQAAITHQGLAGRIFRVGESSASVQLLLDPNLGVACRLVDGREDGIARAGRRGRLIVEGVPVTAKIDSGDAVVTSGMGGIFPPNLFIGTVSEVYAASDGWLLSIEVIPSINFNVLEEVFIVREGIGGERRP